MNHRFTRLLFVLLIVAIPLAAFAGPVGRQRGGGSTMDWELSATGHEKATLRWSCGDGEVSSIEFPNGKNVSLSTRDLGTDIVNAQCTWEVRLTPKVSKDVAKKLEAARNANDDKAARKIMKEAGFDPDAMVSSGAFRVENGAFVSTDATEGGSPSASRRISTSARNGVPIAVDDQVIPDDLIVQGSICVGFDCVNNESFGFDTVRLKENNTRIKFEDTSTGSFPTNDWQLTANDSASGGASKFSIEDITGAKVPVTITAGASTNSIFVDSTGRVGFRTSTPVLDLHVSTSNTPALRLEQTNAGGFTAQTWDIAGNEANFFVRDVTGGSRLPFRIRPGAPTSSVDIAADGDVGIGTANPETDLHVFSTSTQDAAIGMGEDPDGSSGTASAFNFGYAGASFGRGVGFVNVRPDSNAVAPNPSFRIYTVNNERMIVTNTGNVGIGTSSPSSKLHVNGGDIRVSGGSFIDDNVTLNVPDYVFDPSYKLMSLSDLHTFVKENRHLPGVPNAAQVKEQGLNLSQLQLKLLEKVEELTLYVLQQKQEIDELRAAKDELESKLAKSN